MKGLGFKKLLFSVVLATGYAATLVYLSHYI